MPEPRYLLAATLLVALTLAPLAGWPSGQLSAYAQTTHDDGGALLTVAASNENERQDREERRGRNQNDQDDNDDGEEWVPPPPRGQVYEPPPPPDQAGGCLGNGGSLTIALPGGGATVKVFQDNVYAELAKVDPSSVPSPGNLVGQFVFRLTAAPCGGQAFGALPSEANLGVQYSDDAASGRDEGNLVLQYFDGQRWAPAPNQATDPANNYVSATITATGIYALVQQ